MKILEHGVQASAQVTVTTRQLSTVVCVDDALVAGGAPDFTAHERVFVLLPRQRDGKVVWARHDLEYEYAWASGAPGKPKVVAVHIGLFALADADIDAVVWHGVAYGLDSNVGTLWLQTSDDNLHPETC